MPLITYPHPPGQNNVNPPAPQTRSFSALHGVPGLFFVGYLGIRGLFLYFRSILFFCFVFSGNLLRTSHCGGFFFIELIPSAFVGKKRLFFLPFPHPSPLWCGKNKPLCKRKPRDTSGLGATSVGGIGEGLGEESRRGEGRGRRVWGERKRK